MPLSCLGLHLMALPPCQSWCPCYTGTLQITLVLPDLGSKEGPAQRRGLQVMSQVCPHPRGLPQCSPTIWHPI